MICFSMVVGEEAVGVHDVFLYGLCCVKSGGVKCHVFLYGLGCEERLGVGLMMCFYYGLCCEERWGQ